MRQPVKPLYCAIEFRTKDSSKGGELRVLTFNKDREKARVDGLSRKEGMNPIFVFDCMSDNVQGFRRYLMNFGLDEMNARRVVVRFYQDLMDNI